VVVVDVDEENVVVVTEENVAVDEVVASWFKQILVKVTVPTLPLPRYSNRVVLVPLTVSVA
jgi:hypothetical protein